MQIGLLVGSQKGTFTSNLKTLVGLFFLGKYAQIFRGIFFFAQNFREKKISGSGYVMWSYSHYPVSTCPLF